MTHEAEAHTVLPYIKLNPAIVSFGRHESFPLRYGWITKGLSALAEDPGVFAREDATVTLGVGKNMVAAIRYWLLATGMAERITDAGGSVRRTGPSNELARTPIGDVLFPDGPGGDRYLEDDATIWLLHWLLATNPAQATAIYWFYNHFHKPEFTSEEVFAALREFARQRITARTAGSTLKKDANLVLRMYAQSAGGTRLLPEDALDSPLAALQLQERLDRQTWQAGPGEREELPLTAIAYAVADLFAQLGVGQMPVEQLLASSREHCVPGAVFRLTESGLADKLGALCETYPAQLRLDRTAGLYQLYKLGEFEPLAILRAHYQPAPNKRPRRRRESRQPRLDFATSAGRVAA